MERVLNLNDGWEDVVNNPEKREKVQQLHAKRKAERIKKMTAKSMIAGMLGGCALILGATGALSAWLAVPAVFGFGYYGSFLCGRVREAKQ